MDHPAELRGFLTTRRARITPEEAGIKPFPRMRRVPGMRREEVAYLAGVSVDYYTRLERGRVQGISAEVLDAVSRALRLDEVEHEHLLGLVHALRPAGRRSARPRRQSLAEQDVLLQRVLDAIDVPDVVLNARLDVVLANRLGWKLHPHAEQYVARGEGKRFNHLRFQLLDPRAQDFHLDWGLAVRMESPSCARQRDEMAPTRGGSRSSASCRPRASSSAPVGFPRRAAVPARAEALPAPAGREVFSESQSFRSPGTTSSAWSCTPPLPAPPRRTPWRSSPRGPATRAARSPQPARRNPSDTAGQALPGRRLAVDEGLPGLTHGG